MPKKNTLMELGNARGELQRENMEKIAADGVCPFCPEHLKKYHEPPILREGKYWVITPNMYPYENTEHHLLFITKEHISDSVDLSKEAWAELQELLKWVIKENGVAGGTLLMRSGDMKKTGSTVLHLHAQFIVGSDPDKPVLTRVG